MKFLAVCSVINTTSETWEGETNPFFMYPNFRAKKLRTPMDNSGSKTRSPGKTASHKLTAPTSEITISNGSTCWRIALVFHIVWSQKYIALFLDVPYLVTFVEWLLFHLFDDKGWFQTFTKLSIVPQDPSEASGVYTPKNWHDYLENHHGTQ